MRSALILLLVMRDSCVAAEVVLRGLHFVASETYLPVGSLTVKVGALSSDLEIFFRVFAIVYFRQRGSWCCELSLRLCKLFLN